MKTLSYKEAAQDLGVPVATVRRLVRDGRLPVMKLNSRVHRISRDDLAEFVQRSKGGEQ